MKEGWKTVKISEVGRVVGGTTPDTTNTDYWGGTNSWISPAELDGSHYLYDSLRKITDLAVKRNNLQLQPIGTVILSSRAPIGKVAISRIPFYCNQGFKNVICGKELYNEFLYYWFLGNLDYLNSLGKGATFKEISKTIVENIVIPLPPIQEQKQIVEKLDNAFAKIDKIKNNAEKKLREIKILSKGILRKELSPQKGWIKKRIDEISENLDSKRIPITKGDRKQGIYPYYGASGIVDYVDGFLFDEDLLLVSEDGANLVARVTPIAFSVSGKIWVNNHAHVLRFINHELQRFVEYYFAFLDISKSISGMAQPKFNQKALNSIEVYYPSSNIEICSILNRLDRATKVCIDLQFNINRVLNECDALRKAILRQAFNGEL